MIGLDRSAPSRIPASRASAVDVICLALVPVLQLALNPNLFINPSGDYIDPWLYTGCFVSFPAHLAPYIVHKGSIAVDGISLTVAGLGADRLDIMVVPFTMEHTNLGRIGIRERVNLECDMVGKYVVRAAELAGLTLNRVRPGEVTH